MTRLLIMVMILSVSACTTPIVLPSSGAWVEHTETLGPVVVCKGGNFALEPQGCNQWPLSIATMPAPDTHYAELRAKAAEQYQVDAAEIVLKDVKVEYTTEMNGVVRGWRAAAIAGKKKSP